MTDNDIRREIRTENLANLERALFRHPPPLRRNNIIAEVIVFIMFSSFVMITFLLLEGLAMAG